MAPRLLGEPSPVKCLHIPLPTDRLRATGLIRAEDFAMSKLADRYVEIYRQVVDRNT